MNELDTAPRERGQLFSENETALLTFARFFLRCWKIFLLFGLLGFVVAAACLRYIPNRYQSVAYIQMAQVQSVSNNNSIKNLNPLSFNIEEPAQLISRLSLPSAYSVELGNQCIDSNGIISYSSLSKVIKLTLQKNSPNIVELTYFGQSPEASEVCAYKIFEYIQGSQERLIEPYISQVRKKLGEDRLRLGLLERLMARADKSGDLVATYLSARDEKRFLMDEISILEYVLENTLARKTQLIAPIYVDPQAVSPKKILLLFGLLGGGFFGLLFVMLKNSTFILRVLKNRGM